jgi:hypothetical protein
VSEVVSEVERDDERPGNACVVYAIVAVNFDGNKGLYGSKPVMRYLVMCKIVLRGMNGSSEREGTRRPRMTRRRKETWGWLSPILREDTI